MQSLVSFFSSSDPAFEAALPEAMLDLVDSEGQPLIALGRCSPALAFSRLDQLSPGFSGALAATRTMGLPAVLRVSGGRAVAAHPGVLRIFMALPHSPGDLALKARFSALLELLQEVLLSFGLDTQPGQLPGEYCPGHFSLSFQGRKLVGIGQRARSRSHHLCAMLSLSGADRTVSMLDPVYKSLGLEFDADRVGDLDSLGLSSDRLEEALAEVLAEALCLAYDGALGPLPDSLLSEASRRAPARLL